jgi:hypothetical protein
VSIEPGAQQPQEHPPPPGFTAPPMPGSGAPIPPPPAPPTAPLNPYGFAQLPLHPQANLAKTLGIVGLVCSAISVLCCQVLGIAGIGLGIAAWIIAQKAITEIDTAPHSYAGRSDASLGRGLGIGAIAVGFLRLILFAVILAVQLIADPTLFAG